jgi:hypothetical protein
MNFEDELIENNFPLYFADQIFALDTSVGSGKTRRSIQYMAAEDMTRQNFIYVAPTIKLVNQTEEYLRKAIEQSTGSTRNVNLVHSENLGSGGVQEETLAFLSETTGNIGAVAIITTKTFLTILPLIPNKRNWRVILDEAFQPIQFLEWELGDEDPEASKEFFFDTFELLPEKHDRIVPKPDKSQLARDIASRNWGKIGQQWSSLDDYASNITNKALRTEFVTYRGNTMVIAVYAMPWEFSKFHEVIILSALFRESLLYYLWRSFEVDFQSHPYFRPGDVDDIHHLQGKHVSIGHLLHENDRASKYNLQRNWKTGKPQEAQVGERVIDKLLETVVDSYRGVDCLLSVNNWVKPKDYSLPENIKRIPMTAHGLNEYKDVCNVAVLSVTNPEPHQLKWLVTRFKDMGVTEEAIYKVYRIHSIYQAVGRTAVRTKDDARPKEFIVLSAQDARFLHNLFVGSTWKGQIGDLPNLVELSKSHLTVRAKDDSICQHLRKEYRRLWNRVSRGTASDVDKKRLVEVKQQMRDRKTTLKEA